MIEKIEDLIGQKKYPPVLLMFGEEDFLLEEAYDKLIHVVSPDGPSRFELEIYDGDDCTLDNIVASCSSFPFIGERRVVVVKHFEKLLSGRVSKKTEQKSSLAHYLQSPSNTTFLIITANIDSLNGLKAALNNPKQKAKADKLIASAKFPYNVILEKYAWIEFPQVRDSDYPQWIINRFKSLGKQIDIESAQLISANTNSTLRDISNEIEKLMIYSESRKKITVDDVNFVVCASRVYNVFELQKVVGQKDLRNSIKILEKMISVDRQEMLIITMLTRYFIILFKMIEEAAKNSNQFQLAGVMRISPYFVPEYLASLKKYTPIGIEKALSALTEADEQLKSTSADSLFVLEKMLIKIME